MLESRSLFHLAVQILVRLRARYPMKGKVKKACVMFLPDYSMTSKQENFRTRCSSKDVISFTFTDSRTQSLVPHG